MPARYYVSPLPTRHACYDYFAAITTMIPYYTTRVSPRDVPLARFFDFRHAHAFLRYDYDVLRLFIYALLLLIILLLPSRHCRCRFAERHFRYVAEAMLPAFCLPLRQRLITTIP